MRKRTKHHLVWRILSWGVVLGLAALAGLFFYCASLFQELEPMMGQALKSQPSTIYSDIFVLHQGDNFGDTFLTERLKELRFAFTENESGIQWKTRAFEYPESILASDSPLHTPPDQ